MFSRKFGKCGAARAGFRTRALGFWSGLAKDEKGAVAVIAAILLPIVIGGMGLGAETGYWLLKQRKLQHSADVAAYAAAVRHRAGDKQQSIEAAALLVAAKSGYSAEVGTMLVGAASSSQVPGGAADRVSVELTESHHRLFSSIFSNAPVVLKARAVAQIQGGTQACVLALSRTASGAVTVAGSTSVGLTNCSVASNSNASDSFLMEGSQGVIATDCVYAVGQSVTSTGLRLQQCDQVREQAPVTLDPYSNVPEPDKLHIAQLPCRTLQYVSTSTYSLDRLPTGEEAIRFCGGIDIKGTINLKPGLYIIDGGDFSVSAGAVLKGTGVTFLFAGTAAAKLTGNGDIDLSAPASGPYAGILFFGSRAAMSVSHQVLGNSESTLQGTLYMPASAIDFTGNSSTGGACTQIVADRITFTGNSTIQTSCTSGMKDILVGQTVSIIE